LFNWRRGEASSGPGNTANEPNQTCTLAPDLSRRWQKEVMVKKANIENKTNIKEDFCYGYRFCFRVVNLRNSSTVIVYMQICGSLQKGPDPNPDPQHFFPLQLGLLLIKTFYLKK
jgi:hypothetical protein